MKKTLLAIRTNPRFEPKSDKERLIVHELISNGYVEVLEFETEGSRALFITTKGDALLRLHQ
ncbi:MAG: hypothetical protein HDS36_01720 [Bacteroides sp.]|nr:hypothetical protein [Bacteroides sp.]